MERGRGGGGGLATNFTLTRFSFWGFDINLLHSHATFCDQVLQPRSKPSHKIFPSLKGTSLVPRLCTVLWAKKSGIIIRNSWLC